MYLTGQGEIEVSDRMRQVSERMRQISNRMQPISDRMRISEAGDWIGQIFDLIGWERYLFCNWFEVNILMINLS